MKRVLANEYHTKYLERIGVSPSPQAVEYLRKIAPIEQANMVTSLKAKGALMDAVTLSPPNIELNKKVVTASGPAAKHILLLGMLGDIKTQDIQVQPNDTTAAEKLTSALGSVSVKTTSKVWLAVLC